MVRAALSFARKRSSIDIFRNIATNPLSTFGEFLIFVFLAIQSLFNDSLNSIAAFFGPERFFRATCLIIHMLWFYLQNDYSIAFQAQLVQGLKE